MKIDEPRRPTVAERFRGQMDLLTGDAEVPFLPLPLVLLPYMPGRPLTKNQIMSLYEPKPMRRRKRSKRKSDKAYLIRLALENTPL